LFSIDPADQSSPATCRSADLYPAFYRTRSSIDASNSILYVWCWYRRPTGDSDKDI
jgi:hypothetical protein